jgi:hypothetical protein
LFSIAERRKRSADAQGYNALVLGWPELTRLVQQTPQAGPAADSELNFNYQSCKKNRYILLTKMREGKRRGSQLRVLKALEGFERWL